MSKKVEIQLVLVHSTKFGSNNSLLNELCLVRLKLVFWDYNFIHVEELLWNCIKTKSWFSEGKSYKLKFVIQIYSFWHNFRDLFQVISSIDLENKTRQSYSIKNSGKQDCSMAMDACCQA